MRWHHTLSTAGKKKKRENNKFPFCFLSLSACTRSVWSGGAASNVNIIANRLLSIQMSPGVFFFFFSPIAWKIASQLQSDKVWAALFGIVSIACSSAYLLSLSLSGKGEEISCHLSMFQPKVSYSLYTALLYNILHRSRPGPYLRYRHYKQHLRRDALCTLQHLFPILFSLPVFGSPYPYFSFHLDSFSFFLRNIIGSVIFHLWIIAHTPTT
jgi:hypothetical protein